MTGPPAVSGSIIARETQADSEPLGDRHSSRWSSPPRSSRPNDHTAAPSRHGTQIPVTNTTAMNASATTKSF
jgi:hypothetical protein